MKEPFDCEQSFFFFRISEGSAGAQQSLQQSRRKMGETWAAAHRRKNKRQFMPLLSREFSHAHGHFCVTQGTTKKESECWYCRLI